MDENSSGAITFAEFRTGMGPRLLNLGISDEDIHDLCLEFDKKKLGVITTKQFINTLATDDVASGYDPLSESKQLQVRQRGESVSASCGAGLSTADGRSWSTSRPRSRTRCLTARSRGGTATPTRCARQRRERRGARCHTATPRPRAPPLRVVTQACVLTALRGAARGDAGPLKRSRWSQCSHRSRRTSAQTG